VKTKPVPATSVVADPGIWHELRNGVLERHSDSLLIRVYEHDAEGFAGRALLAEAIRDDGRELNPDDERLVISLFKSDMQRRMRSVSSAIPYAAAGSSPAHTTWVLAAWPVL